MQVHTKQYLANSLKESAVQNSIFKEKQNVLETEMESVGADRRIGDVHVGATTEKLIGAATARRLVQHGRIGRHRERKATRRAAVLLLLLRQTESGRDRSRLLVQHRRRAVGARVDGRQIGADAQLRLLHRRRQGAAAARARVRIVARMVHGAAAALVMVRAFPEEALRQIARRPAGRLGIERFGDVLLDVRVDVAHERAFFGSRILPHVLLHAGCSRTQRQRKRRLREVRVLHSHTSGTGQDTACRLQ